MPTPGLYGVSTDSPDAIRMSNAMNQRENKEFVFTGNANTQHVPAYYVRIFNVSDMEQRIERPWVAHNPSQKGKVIIVPACPPGEKYSKPFVISDIVQEPVRIATTGQMMSRGVDGKFLAQDALNPEDLMGSWRTVREIGTAMHTNEGTNLYWWGLFWTVNEVPTDEELTMAKNRLETNYNRLIEEAKQLYMLGDQGRRQIGNTHRRAASYFDLSFEWNQIYKAKKECPECGTQVPTTASICPKCPYTFNWDKALAGGMRTVEQAVSAGVMEPQAEDMAKKPKK